MKDFFTHIYSQFKEFYDSLSPVKRISVIMSTVVAVVTVFAISVMVSKTGYDVLLSNVAPDQLTTVIDKLKQKNVPFKLENNGSVIKVPSELLHATQMTIMSEIGDSKVGSIGLELFDKQEFGVTSYAQKINYQRALQGELVRAINSINSIKRSKVILALPPKKTFLEEGGSPSASVVVDLYPGKKVNDNQVQGIIHLVASAVENLEPNKVTVVNSLGKILSRDSDANESYSSAILEKKGKIESKMERNIETILGRVLGEGNVIAKVDVQLSTKDISTLKETVDADGIALKSQTSEEELLDGSRISPSGVPGAKSNLPERNLASNGQAPGFRQNIKKELKTTNYAVPKSTQQIRETSGQLERVSVAVLVNGSLKQITDEDGKINKEWIERSPAEMAKYKNLIMNSIGFSQARGDSVIVENMQFKAEDFTESTKMMAQLKKERFIRALVKWGSLGLAFLLLLFFVIRPMLAWITGSFQETVEDMLPRTIEELEELQSMDSTLPGMSSALPSLDEVIDPDKAESELLRDRIAALMANDEEKAANAMSLWLARKDN